MNQAKPSRVTVPLGLARPRLVRPRHAAPRPAESSLAPAMLELTLTMGHQNNPLIVHNSRLSIPTDPFAERMSRITSKPSKQRTHEDFVEMSRVEWEGGLYWDKDLARSRPTSPCLAAPCRALLQPKLLALLQLRERGA